MGAARRSLALLLRSLPKRRPVRAVSTMVTTSGNPSYPQPSPPIALEPLQPRSLPPLERPPLPEHLPSPPTPPVPIDPIFSKYFDISTHIVPAAYPRLTPHVPAISPPAFSKDKTQFQASVENTLNEVIGWRVKQWKGELDRLPPNRALLWNCIKRFVKKDPTKGSGKAVTLFIAHANGFPKEIWEPTLAHFLAENEKSSSPVDIAEMWLWEAVNHGDSALLNADTIGGLYDWTDNARDMLNFLLSYLPNDPAEKTLPTHLPRLPETLAASRKQAGFQSRTLVPIGHSFGGCSSLRAAIECPQLFSSMVLVDPILSPWRKGTDLLLKRQFDLGRGAIKRRSHWASKDEALNLFKQSPFFGAWDPAALRAYVEHGIYDDPQGGVRLKMSGILEAMVFSEAMTNYETWQLAETLDPRIELRWVQPEFPTNDEIPKNYMVWRRIENSSNVIIPKASHLIPHERPTELAVELLAFLSRKYGRPQSVAKL